MSWNDKLLIAADLDFVGDLQSVEVCIENGADVNARDMDGFTALMWACMRGNFEIVKYLVERGADVNAKNDAGFTALMMASGQGYFEIVEYLIENGAKD